MVMVELDVRGVLVDSLLDMVYLCCLLCRRHIHAVTILDRGIGVSPSEDLVVVAFVMASALFECLPG